MRHSSQRSGDFFGGQQLSFLYDAHWGASS
jgi:hypothetical protein